MTINNFVFKSKYFNFIIRNKIKNKQEVNNENIVNVNNKGIYLICDSPKLDELSSEMLYVKNSTNEITKTIKKNPKNRNEIILFFLII